MSRLLQVTEILLSLSCIKDVYNHLRIVGKQNLEGVGLWAGNIENSTFIIRETVIPKQTAYQTESGLLYSVDGEELYRVNKWLFENKLTLIAQIHSHPGKAYHSDTDDRYPIIATLGALSIVIPDFAFGPLEIKTWAVFRLLPRNGWMELDYKEVKSLIQIIE